MTTFIAGYAAGLLTACAIMNVVGYVVRKYNLDLRWNKEVK